MTAFSSMSLPILAWLATYAVHSTVLLAVAWIVTNKIKAERAKQLLWRVALLGGIVTASTQALGAFGPARGADFDLAAWTPAESATDAAFGLASVTEIEPLELPAPGTEKRSDTALLGTLAKDADWPLLALVSWLAGGLSIVGLFVLGRRRLDRQLAGARALDSGPLVSMLADLRERAGVRRAVSISIAPRLEGPIATGVLRPRIWLPPRAQTDLAPELQESMLGHELAHIARFDPLWLGLCRALETLFFFQPLNRIARRKLFECAEYLCDEDAVRYTGDRLGLARCLAEVASWIVGRSAPVPACGMADRRSPLGLRVERILDAERRDRRPRAMLPLLALTLGTTVLYAPGFSAEKSPEPLPTRLVLPAAEPQAAPSAIALVLGEMDELERMRAGLNRDIASLTAETAGRRLTDDQRERLRSLQLNADSVNERVDLVRRLALRLRTIRESKAAR